jgi:HD-GYP domain-containing protein (c-di-GMP phosphodiesterase class II)
MAAEAATHDFRAISVDTLQPKRVPPIDLYLKREEEKDPFLFRSRTLPIDKEVLKSLTDNNIAYLYVTHEDFEKYERYLNQYLVSIVNDPNVPIESKCEVTYNYSSQLMQKVYDSEDPAEVVHASEQVVNMVIDVIFQDKKAAHNFLLKTATDFALYSHSVNVCLLGVSLARRALGISKQEALERFGQGLLLHDIGMTTVAHEIYEREDPLTTTSNEEYRRHPIRGLEIVQEFMPISKECEEIILSHHERCNGSGYPEGLRGDQIPIGAKICAIADVFDSLNTKTAYRERMPSFQALKAMQKKVPKEFDETFFREFLFLFLPPME